MRIKFMQLRIPQGVRNKKLLQHFEALCRHACEMQFILGLTTTDLSFVLRTAVSSLSVMERSWETLQSVDDVDTLIARMEVILRHSVMHCSADDFVPFISRAGKPGTVLPMRRAVNAASSNDVYIATDLRRGVNPRFERRTPSRNSHDDFQYRTHRVIPSARNGARRCFGCGSVDHMYNGCEHPQKEQNKNQRLYVLSDHIARTKGMRASTKRTSKEASNVAHMEEAVYQQVLQGNNAMAELEPAVAALDDAEETGSLEDDLFASFTDGDIGHMAATLERTELEHEYGVGEEGDETTGDETADEAATAYPASSQCFANGGAKREGPGL